MTGLASMQANEAAAELHRLRGSAGLLGAQRVQALAAEGEEALRGAQPRRRWANCSAAWGRPWIN